MDSEKDEKALDALLAFVRDEARVCPRPMEWQAFWKSPPNVRAIPGGWEPPAPLVLAGWWDSSNEDRAQRLEEHIRWAVEHNAFVAADQYLRRLPVKAWHHSDPTKPNY